MPPQDKVFCIERSNVGSYRIVQHELLSKHAVATAYTEEFAKLCVNAHAMLSVLCEVQDYYEGRHIYDFRNKSGDEYDEAREEMWLAINEDIAELIRRNGYLTTSERTIELCGE